MEENSKRDNQKGKAKVEDTDLDYIPPKSNHNKDDEFYYVKLFGQERCTNADVPNFLELVIRNVYRVRNKDIAIFLGNEDERLQNIHYASGATIGISSDPLARILCHSYLDLQGTLDEVKIAEMLIEDAIKEMYEMPFVPTALMPEGVFHRGMIVPLLKVGLLLGIDGKNLVKIEVQSGAWIELDTIEPSSCGKSWVRRVSIYGSPRQISNAMDTITRVVYEHQQPVIPEVRMSNPKVSPPVVNKVDLWDWDTLLDESTSTEESEQQESADLEGENEQHPFVEETAHNDFVNEAAAAIDDNGSDQFGNGEEGVEEKEVSSPKFNCNSI